MRELLTRIRAILRRQENGQASVQKNREEARYRFGRWQLDRLARRLADLDGTLIVLTNGEYALLVAFLEAPQRPLG